MTIQIKEGDEIIKFNNLDTLSSTWFYSEWQFLGLSFEMTFLNYFWGYFSVWWWLLCSNHWYSEHLGLYIAAICRIVFNINGQIRIHNHISLNAVTVQTGCIEAVWSDRVILYAVQNLIQNRIGHGFCDSVTWKVSLLFCISNWPTDDFLAFLWFLKNANKSSKLENHALLSKYCWNSIRSNQKLNFSEIEK